MSKPWLIPLLCASLLSASACAAVGGEAPDPKTNDKGDGGAKTSVEPEQPPPKLAVELAVASVQVIEDCPDPPEAAPTEAAPTLRADESMAPGVAKPSAEPAAGAARKAGPGFVQPCTQSTMQLTLAVEGDEPQQVRVAAIRLLDKQGKTVGTLSSRKPTAWVDQSYVPWDETVGAEEVKASYKLSLPDWNAVDAAIGQPSFGYMFKLEVDVEIAGELHTLQSPEFPREEPHVIVT
ncbi:hypothetical protein [Enhygromyxa salina]|uniref:Lipoprotein n=1 Tax=Enhygromyxa salina TaxID=215803 RepID=A0A2S9YVL2_9BACT|nr:hypothetical protein [Enhygromyxa salina]PRQ09120.1 hypothetical protein ENSA7_11100 [Enhygromyxa salina]